MPGQHGETYDPNEEPAPRGGWFRLVERPFPERVDRVSRWVSWAMGGVAALAVAVTFALYTIKPLVSAADMVMAAAIPLTAGALVYGFTRGIGMILVAVYSTARDGSEFVVDWRAVRHDAGLSRTWIVVLEGALLLAAAGVSVWAGGRFIREPRAFDLAVCLVIAAMIYWPPIRRWIAAGRTRG